MPPHDPNSTEREERIQRLLRQIEAELRQNLPEADQTLEQIEQQVVEIGRKVREILEREALDAAGRGYCGPQAPCACGGRARFVAFYRRTVVTLNGEPALTRAYYHCRRCRKGFCPLDRRLQLGRDPHSVGVRALAARFASYLSERQAAAELAATAGIQISARSVQRELGIVETSLEAMTGRNSRDAAALTIRCLPTDGEFFHRVRAVLEGQNEGSTSPEALGMPQVPIGDGFLLYYFDNRPDGSPRIRPARLTLDPANDLLTIEATGKEIWGFADSGGFLARPVTGDYTLTCKVLEKPQALYTGAGEENVKVGPMIREHVFRGGRYAYLHATSGRGILWERRTAFQGANGGAEGRIVVRDAQTRYPLWLRLTKVGQVITASQSNDGVHFTQVGSEQNLEEFGRMNDQTYAGIAFIACSPTGRGLIKIEASSLRIQ